MRTSDNPPGYHVIRYSNGKWTQKLGASGVLLELVGIDPDNNVAWHIYRGNHVTGEVWHPMDARQNPPVPYPFMPFNSPTLYVVVTP